MKVFRILLSLLYHGFKNFQFFVYGWFVYCGFAGIDLDPITGLMILFLLLIPSVGIYIAAFGTSRRIGLLLKIIHGAIVLFVSLVITALILLENDPFWGIIVAVFVVNSPVLIEAVVSYISLTRLPVPITKGQIAEG